MSIIWYPKISYIKNIFKILKKQFPDLSDVYDMDEQKIKGILDRFEHGMPFQDLNFIKKTARFIYDMSNLHSLSDGNKRLAYFTTEALLMKNGHIIIANDYEKVDFMERISTTNGEDEYEDKIKYIEEWFSRYCRSSD